MVDEYKRLIKNLDAFIRKYYVNLLIRGILYLISIAIAVFLVFDLLEYFFYLKPAIKALIFYFWLGITGCTLLYYIVLPLLRMSRIIPAMSHEDAARLLGDMMPDIADKLLNTLQLRKLEQKGERINIRLLNASIEQRAMQFRPIRFSLAIRLSTNKKYLKYALPPLFILLLLIFTSPALIVNPASRLIAYDSTYLPPPPYLYKLLSPLKIEEGKDLNIVVKTEGETVPEELLINIDGFNYLMNKEKTNRFSYRLKNWRKPSVIYFVSSDYASIKYHIKLLKVPEIRQVRLKAIYPKYTRKAAQQFDNLSDLLIPAGTKILWTVSTKQVDSLNLKLGEQSISLEAKTKDWYQYLQPAMLQSESAILSAGNTEATHVDSLFFHFTVIKDEYPLIRIREFTDSILDKLHFFKGYIHDDYGFSRLTFCIKYQNRQGLDSLLKLRLPVDALRSTQVFTYSYDFSGLAAKEGTSVLYYFEVSDNDAITGPKSSRSEQRLLRVKTIAEKREEAIQHTEEQAGALQTNLEQARRLQKQIKTLSERLKSKNKLSWNDKKELKELLKKYEDLQKKIEKMQQERKTHRLKEEQEKQMQEELLKKQEAINKLYEELMTPEMKEMMEELKKMMEKNAKKEDIEKALEKIETDNEFLKEQLERNLEILKQLKVEQKLEQAIEKLDELAKKQEELSEKSREKATSPQRLKQQQDSLNKQFEEFQKTTKELKEANKALQEPNDIKDMKEQEQGITQDMKQSSQALQKGNKRQGSKKQQSAAQKMQKLKEDMQAMQASMESSANTESLEAIHQILDNLMEVSFRQEELISKVRHTSNRDPRFPGFVEEQAKINSELQMVEDSLNKLASRNPSISPMVSREINNINHRAQSTLSELKEMNTIAPVLARQLNKAASSQQYILTSVNNLSLMMNEVMNQMKRQQMQKSGKGSCKKPKPGKGGSSMSIRQMQQALQKQMQEMHKKMQQGKAGKGKGKTKGKSEEQMSEEFARMAAQQEAIRKMLQEKRAQMMKEGRGEEAKTMGKIAKEMEENETDLVNRILTSQSLMRQKEILTRLLEAENAERERKEKEERESKEAKIQKKRNKNLFLQYKDGHNEDMELLRTIPIEFSPFYKQLVNQYFNKQNQ